MFKRVMMAGVALLALGALSIAHAQRSQSVESWTRIASKNLDLRARSSSFNLGNTGRALRAIRFRARRSALRLTSVTIFFKSGAPLRVRRRISLPANRHAGTINLGPRGRQVVRVVVSYKRRPIGKRWQSLQLWGLPAAPATRPAVPGTARVAPRRPVTARPPGRVATLPARRGARAVNPRRVEEARRQQDRMLVERRRRLEQNRRRRQDAAGRLQLERRAAQQRRQVAEPRKTARLERPRPATSNRGPASFGTRSVIRPPKSKPARVPGTFKTVTRRAPTAAVGANTKIKRFEKSGRTSRSVSKPVAPGGSAAPKSSLPTFGAPRTFSYEAEPRSATGGSGGAAPPPPPAPVSRSTRSRTASRSVTPAAPSGGLPSSGPAASPPAPPAAPRSSFDVSPGGSGATRGPASVGTEGGETAASERPAPMIIDGIDDRAKKDSVAGNSPAAHPLATKDYDVMPLFYGTDRKNSKEPGVQPVYDTRRAEKLQLGFALVTVPKSHEMPNVERPWSINIPFYGKVQLGWEDPKKHFTIKELRDMQEAEFLKLVKKHLKKSTNYKDQALIFIHGFNNSFEGALYRTAQIAFDLEFDGAPFVYSWPSAGNWTSYLYDRESASSARPYLKEFLQLVSQKSGAKSVSIIAHSMGTFALLNVLRDLKYTAPDSVKINQIILAAPDIGVNEFKILAKEIKGLSAGVTLYASSNDRALYISREFHGGVPRAGDVPNGSPIIVSGVDSIDVSAISIDTLATNHSSYAQTEELMNDIERLLKTGERPPQKRQPALQTLIKRDANGDPSILQDGTEAKYWRFPPPKL